MDNYELYHHGILGMQWGVRRSQEQLGNRTSRKKRKQLEKARKVQKERKEKIKSGKMSVKDMTPKEIENEIKRLQLEQTYNNLMKDSKNAKLSTDRGKRFVDKMMDSTLDKVADQVVADTVAQSLKVLAVRAANKALKEEGVYTNNKKKS